MLSDEEWAQTAQEIMTRTGLSSAGQHDDAVRWTAVRHAPDHIHIVATLAHQDGAKPRIWNDYYRVREACQAIEQRYGLHPTAPADRTAARRPTRAEHEKARRTGRPEPARITLKRHVATAAAAAASEPEFFARLQQAGVLVRTRLSTRTPGQVTGYAVALPHDTTRTGAPVWYSGGKLAPDLTLPKLRHRWQPAIGTGPIPGGHLTWHERNAIWEHAARTAAHATEQIRRLGATDPAAAADAAWAAADTLRAADAALPSRVIRQAADSYDRAARGPHGRIPRPTPVGNSLRDTARLLSALGMVTGDRTPTAIALILRLAALAETIADLRHLQQRAAQAAAARTAAERLRAAASPHTPPVRERRQDHPLTAAQLAQLEFPYPPGTLPPPTTTPATPSPAHRPSPSPPRSRGPRR